MSAVFLSDVHLRDADSVKSRLVIRFFQEVASRFEKIFILGDLFDVWPGTTPYLTKEFKPVTDTLRGLVKDGHSVYYIEGNHDFRLGKYFTEELGIQVFAQSIEMQLGKYRVYMMHGDLGNPKEIGYKALRFLLRRDTLHFALKAIPDKFIFDVGLKSSQVSRGYQSSRQSNKAEASIRQIYRQTAEQIFLKGYDVVLMGHTHLPDDVTTLVGGRQCRYINTGDWVRNFTYVEFDGERFTTRTHPVTQ